MVENNCTVSCFLFRFSRKLAIQRNGVVVVIARPNLLGSRTYAVNTLEWHSIKFCHL